MAPRLKILSNVIERLAQLDTATTGHLYGVMYEETLTVLTFSINSMSDHDSKTLHLDLQLCMPAEVDLFGILYVDQFKQDIPDAFKDIDVTDNPLLIKYSLGASDVNAFYYIHEKLESIKYDVITENELWQKFYYIRLQANLPFISEKTNVVESLQETRKNLAAGNVAFHFIQSNIYLLGNSDSNSTNSKSAKELLYDIPGNHKNKYSANIVEAVIVGMLLKISNDTIFEEKMKAAPIVGYIKEPVKLYEFSLKIDALSLVGYKINMSQLYEILVESICRNLRLISSSFENQLKNELYIDMHLPELLHFKPKNFGHLLTLVYPIETSTAESFKYRKNLHKRLALDVTQPYFRRGNAIKFQSDNNDGYLLNPHEALIHPENVQISFVNGSYIYYHYMQDGFDDSGWGCAYRSLQTIVSWYRLQGYTDKPTPSHLDIQKCLVQIGDKPSSFIGSKQWIGSTEVGFVLETFLGITIRVLCISSGEEMAMVVSDLVHHFQTQGTPVMIGGGVLAHTIIGISHDKLYEDIRFLILDPHYTGSDHLNIVLNKGWCGWKNKNFWRTDAFYNICLPQKPNCI